MVKLSCEENLVVFVKLIPSKIAIQTALWPFPMRQDNTMEKLIHVRINYNNTNNNDNNFVA